MTLTWSACRPYSELLSEKDGERDGGASDREVPGAIDAIDATSQSVGSFFNDCKTKRQKTEQNNEINQVNPVNRNGD